MIIDTGPRTAAAPDPEAADRDAAARALATLTDWAARATPDERAALDPALRALLGAAPLSRDYPHGFAPDAAYRASLPDLQNGPGSLIRGARRAIQHVGISNFRLPLAHATRDRGPMVLDTSVTGTVSLEADRKGINMSRIMRSFYARAEGRMGFDAIDAVLDGYRDELEAEEARLMLRLSFPMEQPALRSGLVGWQFYDIALETVARGGDRLRIVHLDYVYSSTCPCSLELSEHARAARGQLATPHSQRSVARLSMLLSPGQPAPAVEDLVELCRAAVPTETQAMVKREDEQAFAELNAANPIFVEDAVRLFAQALASDPRIADFRVIASHQESLHSHDAVSVLTRGPLFEGDRLEPGLFQGMVPRR